MFSLTLLRAVCLSAVCFGGAAMCRAQGLEREFDAAGQVSVKNLSGRVTIIAAGEDEGRKSVSLRAESPGGEAVSESEVSAKAAGGHLEIEVREGRGERERIDVSLRVPSRAKVRVETRAGAVDVSGAFTEVAAATDTGTIRADVPLDSVRYSFRWTASRPRFYSEVELGKVKEGRGGRFEVAGRFGDKKAKKEQRIKLDFETERGVILFGVDPASVPTDLRERQLTEAARAVIRSGNQDLIDAIRKITPRFAGEYAATLPPSRGSAPALAVAAKGEKIVAAVSPQTKRLNVNVTDREGRALSGLTRADFKVTEGSEAREVTDVETTRTPFNLVLLLDVSGSIEERLDFVRKSALAFVNTVAAQDRIAIISFSDDVQLISDFTTDRSLLQQRVKDIEAGGGTALYDALAYTLVETLKPVRDERTAIVVISDGDDNRSFIPLPYILETIIETGAVIYPIYIPSGLLPANSAAAAPASTVDPTRTRFLTLTSRADEDGRKLATVSGGVYYPVKRFDELQRAYNDVVAQLRTSYSVSYLSPGANSARARIRVRVAREGAVVRLGAAAAGVASPAN